MSIPPQPRYSKEEFARRGNEIYEREVQPRLTEEDRGKFVAIDIEGALLKSMWTRSPPRTGFSLAIQTPRSGSAWSALLRPAASAPAAGTPLDHDRRSHEYTARGHCAPRGPRARGTGEADRGSPR